MAFNTNNRDILTDRPTMSAHKNVYLIGLMGSGKSTVGRRLAAMVGYQFIDIDQEITNRTGVSIAHIFAIEAEQGFRNRESRLLKEISLGDAQVISTGGGIVIRDENITTMRQSGTVVFLNTPISVLWKRLKDCQHRPLLQGANPKQKLSEIMNQRAPMYSRAANIEIKITTDSAIKTAHKIQTELEQPIRAQDVVG